MTSPTQTTPQSWPWWRWVLTGLITLALALSGYLGWHYLAGGSVIGCGVGSPCDTVLSSRWSSIGGTLPVTGLAAGAYLAMLMCSFYIGPDTPAPIRRLAWRAMLILIGSAAGSALWFFIVQKWIIKAFCPYCMATHITGLILTALILWRAPKECEAPGGSERTSRRDVPTLNPQTEPRRIITPARAVGFASLGLVLAGVMAVCQYKIVPPAVYRGGESQAQLPAVDPRAVPMVGSPDAPYIVNLLFDYKCPHCQQLHFLLNEIVRRYHGKLAFALCPSPLNTQCNPYIPRDVDEFTNSCELAKIGLSVWVAKPEAFAEFDLWMFTLDSGDRWEPRTLEAAKAKAIAMVGKAKFEAAWTNPWVDRYLKTCVEIYGKTIQASNGTPMNAVPKLVYGTRWVIPQVTDADGLMSILHNSLALPEP